MIARGAAFWPLEMTLVERDSMIEQVSQAAANEGFGDSVLPRAGEAGSLRLDAEAFDGKDGFEWMRTAVKDIECVL